MKDISAKTHTARTAHARATVLAAPATIARLEQGAIPKGNPLLVAKVAAVQAAKQTSQIIPYCHPLPIDHVAVEYEVGTDHIQIDVTVKAIYKTGVEMEALTGAAVAALTVYDMLKMLDESLQITEVRLLAKQGGKRDLARPAGEEALRGAVLVMSDTVAAGRKPDTSGWLIAERLAQEGIDVEDHQVVPDDLEIITQQLIRYADQDELDLVLTSGGTGCGSRDVTPEAMAATLEREVPGIAEAARAHGQLRSPFAMLSRGMAGIRGRTLFVSLPGSPRGVAESLDALFPALRHACRMVQGEGHAEDPRPELDQS
jgi:molybdenum cofactor biosynthesis protein MoaC